MTPTQECQHERAAAGEARVTVTVEQSQTVSAALAVRSVNAASSGLCNGPQPRRRSRRPLLSQC